VSTARRNLNRLLRFSTRHLIDFDIHGRELIPKRGRLIVYTNHITFLDPMLACAIMMRDVVPLSKEENLRHLFIGPVVKAYGAIPVRRGEVDTQAFRQSLAVLEAERVLLVAPEGTRSGHGRLQEARDGLALLALRSNSPLIPIGFVGQETFPSRLSKLRRTKVAVWIGKPFRFVAPEGMKIRRQQAHEMTSEAMWELAGLLPAANRGVYGDGVDSPRQWIHYEPLVACAR
jgi:1-acyl-sn-glycerol-3-phosphate acyltransferase